MADYYSEDDEIEEEKVDEKKSQEEKNNEQEQVEHLPTLQTTPKPGFKFNSVLDKVRMRI